VLTCGYLDEAQREDGVALNLRKLNPRETRLVAVTAVVFVVLVGLRLRGGGGALGAPGRPSAPGRLDEIPRIDLKRVDASPPPSKAGERDIFEFGRATAEVEAPPPTVMVKTPVPVADLDPAPPPAPSLPPMDLKFIGSLDNAHGLKVAVLVTSKNEILTGKLGEVVANRYKIGKIGFESVDLEDVTSGQTRRIALKSR
jgi:hypothetical protein